jgi:hypothetical protein
MRISCGCFACASRGDERADLVATSVTDGVGGLRSRLDSRFRSFGGAELLVDVSDVSFHGGTPEAELLADGGERSMRGEESEDAGLRWRQGHRLGGLFPMRGFRLVDNGSVTVRRGRSIRHRPKWLISVRTRSLASTTLSCGNPGEPAGVRRREEFFRRSVELQQQSAHPGQRILSTVRTNATLLTGEWGAFLEEHRFLIGISIDWPRENPRHLGVSNGARRTFDRAIRGLGVRREHGMDSM